LKLKESSCRNNSRLLNQLKITHLPKT